MNISTIKFPIYRIRSYYRLYIDNNITYIDTYMGSYILDNKNLKGTFQQRRGNIKSKKVYPLYKPIISCRNLILNKNVTKMYVDNYGVVFKYNRKRYVKLKYYSIVDKKYINNKIIISVYGLLCKFTILQSIHNIEAKYIGLLLIDNGYMIFDLSKNKKKDSKVKI